MKNHPLTLLLGCCLASSVSSCQTIQAPTPKPLEISIYRLHSGEDCTSGQLLVNGTVVSYALERPWQGNISLISAIPDGTYKAVIRLDGTKGWRVELHDVPNRPNIQIHIGNTVRDSVGCVLVGKGISKTMCTITDSAAAFNALKLALAEASLPDGVSDISRVLTVTFLDYSDGAKFLDGNLATKNLFIERAADALPASSSDIAKLWSITKGHAGSSGIVTAADIRAVSSRLESMNSRFSENNADNLDEVSPSIRLGLDVASVVNHPSSLLKDDSVASLAGTARGELLRADLDFGAKDAHVMEVLSQTSLGEALKLAASPSSIALLKGMSDPDRNLVMSIDKISADQSINKDSSKAQTLIGNAILTRLTTGHEDEVKLATSLLSTDPKHLFVNLADDEMKMKVAVQAGSLLVERIGGHEAATRFEQVYSTVQQFQSLSVAYELGKISPASALNGYVAAASILATLAGPSGSDNAEVLGAIGKLSQQIAEMRKEMNARFDILEKGQRDILSKLGEVLQACETNKEVLSLQIKGIDQTLAGLQLKIDTHNREVTLEEFAKGVDTVHTYARSSDLRGNPDLRSIINGLLLQFYAHAVRSSKSSDFSGVTKGRTISDADLVRSVGGANSIDLVFGLMPEFAARIGLQNPVLTDLPNPIEWKRGTQAYLETRILFPNVTNPEYRDEVDTLQRNGKRLQEAIKWATNPATLQQVSQIYTSSLEKHALTVTQWVHDWEKEHGPIYIGAVPKYSVKSDVVLTCQPCADWTYSHVQNELPIRQRFTHAVSFDQDPLQLALKLGILEMDALPKRNRSGIQEYKIKLRSDSKWEDLTAFGIFKSDFTGTYQFYWPGSGEDRLFEAMDMIAATIVQVEMSRRDAIRKDFQDWIATSKGKEALSLDSASALQASVSVFISLELNAIDGSLSQLGAMAPLGSDESWDALIQSILDRSDIALASMDDVLSHEIEAQEARVPNLASRSKVGGRIQEVDDTLLELNTYRELAK